MTSSILIKNVLLLDNGKKEKKGIYIEENFIREISNKIKVEAEVVIDGENKVAIPGLMNTHTHAAMSLLRGYADDMRLQDWLQRKIWPIEAKLTPKDCYFGAKLACLEMIKSGTTCFLDMYWHSFETARAAKELGLRAFISPAFIDLGDQERGDEMLKENKSTINKIKELKCSRIIPALGPHSIYTVSKENLQKIKEFSNKEKLLIHFHLSETEKEVKDCLKLHEKRPVEYLEEIGFLGENLIAAHAIWLNTKEIKTLKKYDVKISHCPTSNMKLCSGVLPYEKMKMLGLKVTLGTDSAASNNNLDMFQEMKFATLLQKIHTMDPTSMPVNEIFQIATINGAIALNLNAGEIKEGKLADIALIDLKRVEMTPCYDLIANLVYSANGNCVSDLICDGKILMLNREIPNEEKILEEIREVVKNLINSNC